MTDHIGLRRLLHVNVVWSAAIQQENQ